MNNLPLPLRLDARAWVVWTMITAVLVTTTRNPFYTLILLLAARLVSLNWGGKAGPFQLPLLRLLIVILIFSTTFNLFFVHLGQTMLFTLPAHWPLIGGPITLEAAVYGAINGFMLFTLLVVFIGFNNVVPGSDLVHLTPRLFHNLGLVTLIALTYVPETRRHWQKIQEAQAIRGHQVRGWRDWRPILIPLLVGGMERAMSLAEAMVARGYGATASAGQPVWVQLLLLLGLGVAFAGWALSFWAGWPGWALLGVGILILAAVVWQLGRRSPQISRYEAGRWGWREWVVVGTAVFPLLLLLLPWPFVDQSSLAYSPYPQVTLPAFDPLIGFSLALLAVPAFLNQSHG